MSEIKKKILNQGNIHIDILHHQLNQMNPTAGKPHNFVYVTKRDALYVTCSLYALFFFYRLMNVDTHKIPEG